MIELGRKAECKRSKERGALKADASFESLVSTTRTSENAWCSYKAIVGIMRFPRIGYWNQGQS